MTLTLTQLEPRDTPYTTLAGWAGPVNHVSGLGVDVYAAGGGGAPRVQVWVGPNLAADFFAFDPTLRAPVDSVGTTVALDVPLGEILIGAPVGGGPVLAHFTPTGRYDTLHGPEGDRLGLDARPYQIDTLGTGPLAVAVDTPEPRLVAKGIFGIWAGVADLIHFVPVGWAHDLTIRAGTIPASAGAALDVAFHPDSNTVTVAATLNRPLMIVAGAHGLGHELGLGHYTPDLYPLNLMAEFLGVGNTRLTTDQLAIVRAVAPHLPYPT